jgi:VanZ family protein
MNHLKKHVIFYLGLAQLVLGWVATIDLKTLTFSAVAVSLSGLIAVAVKYVQANLPDDDSTTAVPTTPVKPAILGEVK